MFKENLKIYFVNVGQKDETSNAGEATGNNADAEVHGNAQHEQKSDGEKSSLKIYFLWNNFNVSGLMSFQFKIFRITSFANYEFHDLITKQMYEKMYTIFIKIYL